MSKDNKIMGRIDLRVPPSDRALWEIAAALEDRTLSNWIRFQLNRAAKLALGGASNFEISRSKNEEPMERLNVRVKLSDQALWKEAAALADCSYSSWIRSQLDRAAELALGNSPNLGKPQN